MPSTVTTTVATAPRYGSRVGNLTRDPELRYSPKGSAWASCGLAVNRRKRNEDGSFEDLPPEFYGLVCFGDLAEHLCESLRKGDRVVVVGKLEADTWIGHDGAERTTTKLVADDIGASLRFATVSAQRVERKTPAPSAGDYGYSEKPF